MERRKLTRRDFLRLSAIASTGAILAACAPKVVKETVVVEKPVEKVVEKVVKETVIVEGTPKVVEKVITATPVPKEPTTITWMNWGGVERFGPLLDKFYQTYPEMAEWLKVEVVSGGKHDGEMYQTLRLALAAGGESLPDLVTMNYIGVPEFAMAGQLMDLRGLLAPYLDDMVAGAKALATYEGKYFTIPFQPNPKVWYYRKDLFEEAGIDTDAVKTFEDYMAAGEKYHQTHPDSYIMNIGPQPIHYWYFMILSHWDEVRVADKDGHYFITEDPHFATMMQWLKTWYTSGIAFNTDDWSADWGPAIADGKIGGFLISAWMSPFLAKFAPEQGGKWALTLWPEFNRTGSEAGGGVVCIPNGAQHPEAAFEFASKQWLEAKGSVEYWKMHGAVPVTKSAQEALRKLIPTMERPEGMSDEEWKVAPVNYFGKEFMEPVFAAMDLLKVFPYDPSASAELTILRQHTEAYLADKETLEEALAGAQKDMEAQIGNPYET